MACVVVIPLKKDKGERYGLTVPSDLEGECEKVMVIKWALKKFVLLNLNSKAKQDVGKLTHCHSVLFFLVLDHQVILIKLGRTFVGQVMSLLFNMLSRFAIAFLPRSKHLLSHSYGFSHHLW